jgi:hypothetical protein
MQFWLPGSSDPIIWITGKCFKIDVPEQYSDREAAGKQEYIDGAVTFVHVAHYNCNERTTATLPAIDGQVVQTILDPRNNTRRST